MLIFAVIAQLSLYSSQGLATEYKAGDRISGMIFRACLDSASAVQQIKYVRSLAAKGTIPISASDITAQGCYLTDSTFQIEEIIPQYSGHLGWILRLDSSSRETCDVPITGTALSYKFPCQWALEHSKYYRARALKPDGTFAKDKNGEDFYFYLEVYPSRLPALQQYAVCSRGIWRPGLGCAAPPVGPAR